MLDMFYISSIVLVSIGSLTYWVTQSLGDGDLYLYNALNKFILEAEWYVVLCQYLAKQNNLIIDIYKREWESNKITTKPYSTVKNNI